jgi:hypothetical protein
VEPSPTPQHETPAQPVWQHPPDEAPVGGPKNGSSKSIITLGIHCLSILLAHSIAVNTSHRSYMGITNPDIQALIVSYYVIQRK